MDCKATPAQMESLRLTIHAAVDAMLERLQVALDESEPTLEGLERSVLRELHTLGSVMLTALCEALVPAYPPAQVGCGCGGTAHYQRRRTAQCKTLVGIIHLQRPYYLCPACHAGHCPLDRALGFCAGSVSDGLEALLALLGTEFSYGHAAEMVERLSLVQVSASRCRKATNTLGEALAEHEEAVRHAVWERGQEPPSPSQQTSAPPCDPLYIAADGVIIHSRESGWREQCVGAVYTAAPPSRPAAPWGAALPDSDAPVRSRALSYLSELGSRPAFAELLWLEAHRRGLEAAQQVVFLGDGAQWLWQLASDLFPQALQVLDWYHVTTYVWQAAQALYPSQETERTQWAGAQLTALWHSRTDDVIATLEPLAAGCAAAREALHYFTTHLSRMDYAHYRSLGLQLGSGTIESACKHVIQARIKQAGMRWCVRNARCLGKLRARLKSGRWDETLALRPPRHRTYHRPS
jgi:hypothetical protein